MSKQKRRKRRVNKRVLSLLKIFLMILAVFVIGRVIFLFNNPVVLRSTSPTVELKDVKYNPLDNVRYVFLGSKSDIQVTGDIDTTKLGKYPVTLKYKNEEIQLTYNVVDTTPPELTVKDYQTDTVETVKPKQFVQECKDATEVTFSFKEEPTKESGRQRVTIVATDTSGNKTEKKATLRRTKDKKAPTITGLDDIEIKQNRDLDLEKGVTVTDDIDTKPTLEIDETHLDISTPGTYTVTYKAMDRSGNVREEKRQVTVIVDEDMNRRIVYLTFDDGPSANTKNILKILKKYDAKATFFVTGANEKYDDLMKDEYDDGHTVALHTFSHNYAQIYSSVDDYFADLQKISDLVEKQTGEKSYLVRFPGGSSNSISANYTEGIMTELTELLPEKGYQYFDWNVSSGDASADDVPAETLIANSTSSDAQHIIILMHDTEAKSTTVEALPAIIEYYQAKGYEFKALEIDSYAAHHAVFN